MENVFMSEQKNSRMNFFSFRCDFGEVFSTQEFHVLMIEKAKRVLAYAFYATGLWFSDIFRGFRKRPVASNAFKAVISAHCWLAYIKFWLCSSLWENNKRNCSMSYCFIYFWLMFFCFAQPTLSNTLMIKHYTQPGNLSMKFYSK